MEFTKGPSGLLSSTQHVSVDGQIKVTGRPGILRCFFDYLDRRSGCNTADQVAGRQYVCQLYASSHRLANHLLKLIHASCLYHWIYSISTCRRRSPQCPWASFHCPNSCIHRSRRLVHGCRSQHLGRIRGHQEPSWSGGISTARVLRQSWLSLFY